MTKIKNRAFLKWAGGKFKLVDAIQKYLPHADRLVEPFVGAGSVFLNIDFDDYLLCDINPDLINLYNIIKSDAQNYIEDAQEMFCAKNNQAEHYYAIRSQFNESHDVYERAVLFLYLNRYGYNGLCRYNKSGGFNVPFGRYKAPYFPKEELIYFAERAQKATFQCLTFEESFAQVTANDSVYCDPPYAPLTKTAQFTQYAGNGFGAAEQEALAKLAADTSDKRNISVLISNHSTAYTREIYKDAKQFKLKVNRFISQKGHKRNKVNELFALYQAKK